MPGNRTGKNRCTYPRVKTPELCGKTCDGFYCSVHIKNERRNLPWPSQCEQCGVYMRTKKPTTVCWRCAIPYEEYVVTYKYLFDPFTALDHIEHNLGSQLIASAIMECVEDGSDTDDSEFAMFRLCLRVKTQKRLHLQAVCLNIINAVEPDFEGHVVVPTYTNLTT